ncbi:MAG TPA: hypothetical protein DHW02_16410 [Ktedonobacter sp.]|nr:hypothetical protein [Ktedonobacter sp.]
MPLQHAQTIVVLFTYYSKLNQRYPHPVHATFGNENTLQAFFRPESIDYLMLIVTIVIAIV